MITQFSLKYHLSGYEKTVFDYIEQLTELFSQSPEGQQIVAQQKSIQWTAMFMEYAYEYQDTLVPEMSEDDVEEVVFDIFPETLSTPATEAPHIINELRAFWQFLAREYHLENAPRCVQIFTDEAVTDLTELLADPLNYGMAKSMVMEGLAQDIDMTDEKQVNKWMAEYNEKLAAEMLQDRSSFPHIFDTPFPSDPYGFGFGDSGGKQKADKAKKAKRKMKKASQKKNRKHK
ncbi:MAG: hypothetical protein H0X30_37470 [Anaerolineae bacterium]|nr:hypothetical protein [Anaerolineae bacterium]